MTTLNVPSDVLERYKAKVKDFCDGLDPYTLDMKKCCDALPDNVGFFDIVNYCIFRDSTYTNEAFKAYKALDAYKFYDEGWINQIGCKKQKSEYLVVARVKHSQRLRETPLSCWVSIDLNGIVLCGHCNCMAGLGEVCSHVGAVLFLLADWCKKSKELGVSNISCTDVLAKWCVPTKKDVAMAVIKDIKWNNKVAHNCIDPLPAMTDSEINELLNNIRKTSPCVLMALRKPFSEKFVPVESREKVAAIPTEDEYELDPAVINLFLASLHHPEFEAMNLEDLISFTDEIELSYSDEAISFIEMKTRLQSKSKLWYRFRTGRVTGSIFKEVCRTRIHSPSMTLLSKICYPESSQFSSKYTKYGKDNEDNARQDYLDEMIKKHENFVLYESGLVINKLFPHCGVSPDGITNCDCCGEGCLEVKCPWYFQHNNIKTYFKSDNCALYEVNGHYYLKKDHGYYYQVQFQIILLNVEFCDFVVWNKKRTIIIRVQKDLDFWNEQYPKTEVFWRNCVVPELLGCYYTRMKEEKAKREQEFLANS